MTKSAKVPVISAGENLLMVTPRKVWKLQDTNRCPICKSGGAADTKVYSQVIGEFSATKYDCGAIFVYSPVLGGSIVIMHSESKFCRLNEDKPEDTI